MKQRNMSLEAQLKGVKAAIASPRTPQQLRKALNRRAAELERKLRERRPGLFMRRGL